MSNVFHLGQGPRKTVRIRNLRNNTRTLMTALRQFSKENNVKLVRLHKGHGDSLQVFWDMIKTEVAKSGVDFETGSVIAVRKIREGKGTFTETLPLNFSNIDRAALVKTLVEHGVDVKNVEGSEFDAILVKIGASPSEIPSLPEYDEYIKGTAEYIAAKERGEIAA
tara:strand:- start:70475 stop:70972 length:498 start_codon:yes stop_codon:yes gene_type:complete